MHNIRGELEVLIDLLWRVLTGKVVFYHVTDQVLMFIISFSIFDDNPLDNDEELDEFEPVTGLEVSCASSECLDAHVKEHELGRQEEE